MLFSVVGVVGWTVDSPRAEGDVVRPRVVFVGVVLGFSSFSLPSFIVSVESMGTLKGSAVVGRVAGVRSWVWPEFESDVEEDTELWDSDPR